MSKSPLQVKTLRSLDKFELPTVEYSDCQYSHKPVSGGVFVDHTTRVAQELAYVAFPLLGSHKAIAEHFGFQTPRHARWARYAILAERNELDGEGGVRKVRGPRGSKPVTLTADEVLALVAEHGSKKAAAAIAKAIAAVA